METYDEYKLHYKAMVRQMVPREVAPLTTEEEVTFDILTAPLEAR